MSFSIRATQNQTSRWKKVVVVALVIGTLFLLGTVIVLSSVSYSLALPAAAFLTEEEVAWRPQDIIKTLQYNPRVDASVHRSTADSTNSDQSAANETSDIWDVDGPGSGGYWMRKDWAGEIQGTRAWDHLYNATTL